VICLTYKNCLGLLSDIFVSILLASGGIILMVLLLGSLAVRPSIP